MQQGALIVGAGSGISASLARLLEREGYAVALASRGKAKRADGPAALRLECDAADPGSVAAMFARLDAELPPLDVVLYNPSYRTRGPLVELAVEDVRRSLDVTAFGAFLVAQQAARRMLARGRGNILFTGASASVKGYAQSAPFAMGKFALRGLAQSMARELAPRNIHVAHLVIDGGVRSAERREAPDQPDSMLDPDAIAQTYLQIIRQPRSAWAWEIELRPWVEKF
ncbi:MAG TPA: SDR family NAD(P)-dependent oxidoreductase [Burkholderiales bacterium]|jgi:NAD(P)-dependent dehydrogenase (short-subunit alcohol dehydrogenase family)